MYPPHPEKPGEVALDLETSLVDTWKAMIALPKSKVCLRDFAYMTRF
jgi:L-glyceraldehyde reductase